MRRRLNARYGDALPFFIRDGGFIAGGYDAALDELRELQSSTKSCLAKLQAGYAAKTGIKSLKIQYNQVFGYFVEVGPASAAALQAGPHASSSGTSKRLPMRCASRPMTSAGKPHPERDGDALSRELALFDELASAVLEAESAIARAGSALASLDCLSALGELAQAQNYVRPRVDASRSSSSKAAAILPWNKALAREGMPFIANDCKLDGAGERAPGYFVVTRAEHGGQIHLSQAERAHRHTRQMGSYVPAAFGAYRRGGPAFRPHRSRRRPRARPLYLHGGDDRNRGDPEPCERQSLVILDEIGRGAATSTAFPSPGPCSSICTTPCAAAALSPHITTS